MANEAEHKNFFIRDTQVNTGTTPDKEVGFPVEYLVKGVKKFNRFLQGHVPSENVFKKLFNSIPFKLDKADTASSTVQGLVKKATDAQSITRLANPNTDFTIAVAPHQLPQIVLATDVNDTVISDSTDNGIKLSLLTRAISSISRRNYKIEVVTQNSVVINNSTKKIELSGDVGNPGNLYYYGTNNAGVKGFYALDIPILPVRKTQILSGNFAKTDNTLSIITSTTSSFTYEVLANKVYKIKAQLFINASPVGGVKFGCIVTGVVVSNMIVQVSYITDATPALNLSGRLTTLGGTLDITGVGDGYCIIEGVIEVSTAGTFNLAFAQKTTNGTASEIKQGSNFIIEEYDKTYP